MRNFQVQLAGGLAGIIMAQTPSGFAQVRSDQIIAGDLRRVEPGEADVNPLFVTTRDLGIDLRQPVDFRDLFQIRSDAPTRLAGRFARVAGGGGLVAVFPRGRYIETSRGLFAETPPDTIFFVGGLPLGAADPAFRPDRIDTRIEQAVESRYVAAESQQAAAGDISRQLSAQAIASLQRERNAQSSEGVARLFVDDAHRSRTVDALLQGR